jgi:lysophospholipase L1-like esterase
MTKNCAPISASARNNLAVSVSFTHLQKKSYLIAAAVAVLLGGCGSPNEPGPTPAGPAISCPANMTVHGVPGSGQAVTYPPATVTGGTSPVTTTCTPASGSSFNVGTTAVSCTAVDAASRQAQCSFTVTSTPLLVSVTKYLAFGDSLTIGENGREGLRGERIVDVPNAYPTKLQSMLNLEYPGQAITVPNYGKGGEPVGDSANDRLEGALARERPGAVLLLDGYNNLGSCTPGASNTPQCGQAIVDVAFGIRDLARIAKRTEYGVRYIFVSTMTPPGPYLGIGRDRRIANDAIVRANGEIAKMVRSEGVILVDTYPKFVGHEAEYVDQDGLHLRPAGYQALADSFFSVIKTTVTSTPGFAERLN